MPTNYRALVEAFAHDYNLSQNGRTPDGASAFTEKVASHIYHVLGDKTCGRWYKGGGTMSSRGYDIDKLAFMEQGGTVFVDIIQAAGDPNYVPKPAWQVTPVEYKTNGWRIPDQSVIPPPVVSPPVVSPPVTPSEDPSIEERIASALESLAYDIHRVVSRILGDPE